MRFAARNLPRWNKDFGPSASNRRGEGEEADDASLIRPTGLGGWLVWLPGGFVDGAVDAAGG